MGKSHAIRQVHLRRLADAVASLYEPCPPERMSERTLEILERLVRTDMGASTTMRRRPDGTTTYSDTLLREMEPALLQRWAEVLGPDDTVLAAFERRGVRFAWERYRNLCRDVGIENTVIYKEVLEPMGATDTLSFMVRLADGGVLALAGHRRGGLVEMQDMALLDAWLPHAARALQTRIDADPACRASAALAVFDRRGRAVFVNPAARRLMGEGGATPGPVMDLDSLRAVARRAFELRRTGSLADSDPDLRVFGAYRADFVFDEPDGDGEPQTVAVTLRPLVRTTAAAGGSDGRLSAILSNAGAGPAEIAVARLLLAGRMDKEIARELGRSIPTVQFHVRNLLRRFGLSRRAEWIGRMTERVGGEP